MSIDLVNAATVAAELRSYLKSENTETFLFSKKDIRNLLDVVDKNIASSFRELNYEEKQRINDLVTVQLLKENIISQEFPIQPDVMPPTQWCEHPYLWSCYDGVATEVEVLEFLHALVRMLKPKFIVETGTYLGYGAVYMALAQKKNGFGDLLTCDIDENVLQRAISLAMQNEVELHMQFVKREGIEVLPQLDDRSIDLAFIDSGSEDVRIDEINRLLCKLALTGIGVVHDISNYERVRKHLEYLHTKGQISLVSFLQTPRGISIFERGYR